MIRKEKLKPKFEKKESANESAELLGHIAANHKISLSPRTVHANAVASTSFSTTFSETSRKFHTSRAVLRMNYRSLWCPLSGQLQESKS